MSYAHLSNMLYHPC